MIGPFRSVLLSTLLPLIVKSLQLFAVYVVVHGHYSPGGGFQGGAVLGVSFILPLLVAGRDHRLRLLTERGAAILATVGVLIFALIGVVPVVFGRAVLDYAALPLPGLADAARRSLGILGIEVGVTLAVAGAVVSIFYSLYAEHDEEIP